jgi:hypothetical protein
MPAHHKLEAFIDAYLDASGLRGEGKGSLFRFRCRQDGDSDG